MTTVLLIIVGLLTVLLGVSVYLLVRLGKKILELEEQVEKSLDVLDASYRRINSILDIPVMTDEPFVRQVLGDIRHARDAVLLVAHRISTFYDEGEDGGEE